MSSNLPSLPFLAQEALLSLSAYTPTHPLILAKRFFLVPMSTLHLALLRASKDRQKSTTPPFSCSLNLSYASSPSRSPLSPTSSSASSPLIPQRRYAYCTTRPCRHGRSLMVRKSVEDLNSEPGDTRTSAASLSFYRIQARACRLNISALLVRVCRCLHGNTPL